MSRFSSLNADHFLYQVNKENQPGELLSVVRVYNNMDRQLLLFYCILQQTFLLAKWV